MKPLRFCSNELTRLMSAFWLTWLMVVVLPWVVLATSCTLPVISFAFCVKAEFVA